MKLREYFNALVNYFLSSFAFLKYRHVSQKTIQKLIVYGISKKPCRPSARITFAIPATYPVRTTRRKPTLFPFAVRALHDLAIENGQATPKHMSIIVSRIFCQSIIYNSFAEIYFTLTYYSISPEGLFFLCYNYGTHTRKEKLSDMKKTLPLNVAAILIFIIVFIVSITFNWLEPKIEEIDEAYIKAHRGQYGFILVDVRDEDVYEGMSPSPGLPGGHIPGAISFPLMDLNVAAASAAMAKVGITKRSTIMLYCSLNRESDLFANYLVNKFYFPISKVKRYRDGITDWIRNPQNILLPEDHE